MRAACINIILCFPLYICNVYLVRVVLNSSLNAVRGHRIGSNYSRVSGTKCTSGALFPGSPKLRVLILLLAGTFLLVGIFFTRKYGRYM